MTELKSDKTIPHNKKYCEYTLESEKGELPLEKNKSSKNKITIRFHNPNSVDETVKFLVKQIGSGLANQLSNSGGQAT